MSRSSDGKVSRESLREWFAAEMEKTQGGGRAVRAEGRCAVMPLPVIDSPAEVLRIAADMVERGWCKRAFQVPPEWRARVGTGVVVVSDDPEATCFCALGAIRIAAGGEFALAYEGAVNALAELLVPGSNEEVQIYGFRIQKWNDAPERGKSDVVSMMRAAAERCKDGPVP